jgi:hypothetical protein
VRTTRSILRVTAASAAVTLVGSGVAWAGLSNGTPRSTDGAFDNAVAASHALHKHGGQDGHLSPSVSNMRLVGEAKVHDDEAGRVADVGVHEGYAYLTAFNDGDCKKGGVYVFDVRNPAKPKEVAYVRGANGSYAGEGSQALSLDTPEWSGDLLLFNNETCTFAHGGRGTDHSTGGISLVDVSNPKVPKLLVDGFGDYAANGKAHTVHSVFAWQPEAGGPAYAVMVDNEEATDVDIVDISDPTDPEIIAEYDLNSYFTGGQDINDGVKGSAESFLHDMVVKEIDGRQVMLASYWDGGYVTMDVTDPRNATYLGDTDFAAVDEELLESTGDSRVPEGNAHQAEFNLDSSRILAADEDFSPFSLTAKNTTDNSAFDANSGDGTRQPEPGTTLAGATVFVGRACPGDPAVPSASGFAAGSIAVVERGVCTFTEKVAAVESAGWGTALVVNRTASDGCEATLGMSVEGGIHAFGVAPRSLAYSLFNLAGYDEAACEAGDGTQQLPIALGALGDSVEFDSYFDGWGYVRLFENEAGKMTQLDTFAIPEAHDQSKAVGFGDLSVHEIAFSERDPNLAYVSYYAGGTRVLRIDGDQIVDSGHWVDGDGSNVWGVQVFEHAGKEYVAASDRDFGLQIFEYTGPGAVNP